MRALVFILTTLLTFLVGCIGILVYAMSKAERVYYHDIGDE